MDDYSDILEKSPENLGMGGYCFIVVELLLELHPSAEIYRLTESRGSGFAHVYLVIDGVRLDVKGFRDLEEIIDDLGGGALNEERTNLAEIQRYFHKITVKDEREVAARVLRKFIASDERRYKGV